MLEDFLTLAQTETSAAIVLFNLILAFAVGIGISFVYQKTHQGLSYSRPFLSTLVLMTVLGSVVMMVVSQNFIGAFALLGAFSLIRFRTILKETRDIAFVFFALVEGVAVGTNNYVIALLSTAVVSGMIFLLKRINFGSIVKGGYLVTVVAGKNFSPDNNETWKRETKDTRLLHMKTIGGGMKEYTLNAFFDDKEKAHVFVVALENVPGVEQVDLMSGDNVVEY